MYFSVIVLYSIFVYFDYAPLKEVFGFIRVPVLMLLYFFSSLKKDYWYFLALLLFQAAYVLFNQQSDTSLLIGAIVSVLFRISLLIIIFRAISDKRWKTIILTSLPIVFIFWYLVNLIKENVQNSYYIWLLNGFLTAFVGGLAVSNYCYKEDRKSYWLLISALLFVVQVGLFFVNRFYLKQQIFLQLIIVFYGVSHYTFYRFMVYKDEELAKKAEK
ncbi:hypothetical protein [Flavobacterium pedocola]